MIIVIISMVKIDINLTDCPDCKGTGKSSKGLFDKLAEIGGQKSKDCKRCEGTGKVKIR